MHVVFQLTSALCHAQFARAVEDADLKGRVQELQGASAGAVTEYIAREKKVSFWAYGSWAVAGCYNGCSSVSGSLVLGKRRQDLVSPHGVPSGTCSNNARITLVQARQAEKEASRSAARTAVHSPAPTPSSAAACLPAATSPTLTPAAASRGGPALTPVAHSRARPPAAAAVRPPAEAATPVHSATHMTASKLAAHSAAQKPEPAVHPERGKGSKGGKGNSKRGGQSGRAEGSKEEGGWTVVRRRG